MSVSIKQLKRAFRCVLQCQDEVKDKVKYNWYIQTRTPIMVLLGWTKHPRAGIEKVPWGV